MFVTGSPFPPYAPIDVNVYLKPDLRTKGSRKFAHDAVTNFNTYVWTKKSRYHRAGDLPARITTKGSYTFYIGDIKHRINGVAECEVDSSKRRDKHFFLYGHRLTEAGFKYVHQLAIYHELPLWFLVFGIAFKKDIDMPLGDFAVEMKKLLETFPNIDTAWMVKLWGVDEDEMREVSSHQFAPKYFLYNLKQVIDAETEEFRSLTATC